jgi:tRNA 5-methylaminomethyl-2-thiouridine biosynthesis bifunctional protein
MSSPENPGTITDWINGQPYSRIFGDVYFSRDSGIAETRFVFLHHNHLPERWQTLQAPHFTIAETGFGTGLNFLCAWQLWQQTAPPHAALHFVSTELYPLPLADIEQALALWPELAPFASQLVKYYPHLARGWNRFYFEHGRVVLTLLVGDAVDTLPQLHASVDAWFLDGFAPAKNPGLWQAGIFSQMARLSSNDATFATYTSAGAVKRGLQEAGFTVEKVSGHGNKREMLRGSRTKPTKNPDTDRRAIVIGGGIAGTSSANSLARRGFRVTLIERHSELAQEASGNALGVLYPRLSGHDIPLSRLAHLGFRYTLGLLQSLDLPPGSWESCGLLQLGFDAREARRCGEVALADWPRSLVRAVDAASASTIAGLVLGHGGLYFPDAGWLKPASLCNALAGHSNITVLANSEALRLAFAEGHWQVYGAEQRLAEAPVVVIACANQTASLAASAHLPLQGVRGQITLAAATPATQSLKTVVCTDGYVSPAINGVHCLGATFSPNDAGLEVRASDHAHNLSMLKGISRNLHQALKNQPLQGRAALRCATPDYLPMAGMLLDAEKLKQIYEPGSRASADLLPWLHGLYVNTGHGSKGMLTAPLCAEVIAAQLCHEPMPVDAGLLKALNPNRFLLRERGLRRLLG